ncbi:MAG: NAD-dependent epimerase/dehydratase family protein, partial [Lachnospiraceae bacterium]|nr:NAD-dependent epimerase/dehydratase family protein [Lachnospiraceae bacterium]
MHKNVIVEEDSKLIAKGECIDWELLNNTTVLVTGSTGIIGSTLVKGLLMRNEQYNSNITVISLVRNIEKYNKIYCEYMNNPYIIPVMGDICDFKVDDFNIEYIIHAACETSSQKFVSNPVDTINTMVCGTNYIMQCAVKKHVRGVVFLSSMEVYGKPQENQIMRENEMGYLDPVSVRSSYSEGKRICETLCVSYATQFNLPVKMIRLA